MNDIGNTLQIRTTHVQYPRDGALIEALVRLVAAWRRHRANARRAREAEPALACMSERDLADIGLTVHDVRRLAAQPRLWPGGG